MSESCVDERGILCSTKLLQKNSKYYRALFAFDANTANDDIVAHLPHIPGTDIDGRHVTLSAVCRIIGQDLTFSETFPFNIHTMYIALDYLACDELLSEYLAFLSDRAYSCPWSPTEMMQLHRVDTLTHTKHLLVSIMFAHVGTPDGCTLAHRDAILAGLPDDISLIYPLMYWATATQDYPATRHKGCVIAAHTLPAKTFRRKLPNIASVDYRGQYYIDKGAPTICPAPTFEYTFAHMTGNLLCNFDWTNILAAGPAVYECLRPAGQYPTTTTPVDLYVYGTTRNDRRAAMCRAIMYFAQYEAFFAVTHECVVVCVRGVNRNIRIIYTTAQNATAVLHTFAIDYLACGFDTCGVGMLPTCIRSLVYRCVYGTAHTPTRAQLADAHHAGFVFADNTPGAQIRYSAIPRPNHTYYFPAHQAAAPRRVNSKMANSCGADICPYESDDSTMDTRRMADAHVTHIIKLIFAAKRVYTSAHEAADHADRLWC